MVVGVGLLLVVGVHRMAPVLFFVFFLLPLLLRSAEEGTYFPDCPGMSCGNMGPLSFPFTNATRPECGLIKVRDCNETTRKIQLERGGRWYDASVSLIGTVIHDQELKNHLKSSSCDALNSFTLPISPFWYFINITMYKCNHSLSVPLSTDFNYTNCNHVFHYNHLKNHLPSLPSQCSVIQLPLEPTRPIKADPFSFLTADILLHLRYYSACVGCKNGKGQCRFYHNGTFQCVKRKAKTVGCKNGKGQCRFYHNGTFQCVKAKAGNKRMVKRLALGIGLPVVFIIILLFFYIVRCHYKRKYGSPLFLSSNISSDPNSKSEQDRGCLYFGIPIFSYSELEEATNNFDSNKELGDGGFGTVYYGKLQDGREVAVKRLYESNYRRVEQFMNEVEILTRLRHKNLVSLYGCTSRHSRELLLVYEYIPNGTVADHLHGDQAKPSPLSWSVRMSIAIETASALAYLHSSDIIHRDVKTNNILLDDNFSVKVADFGLSRLFPTDVTHISTAPQGTPGYVDPEYHQCYQLTVKSDVYSFGVVLIELISSLPAVDISRHRHEINLSNLALNKIQNRAFHELVDPCLGFETNFTVRVMTTLVAELAFRCLQQDKEIRPSMEEVLEVLEGIQNENYEMEKTEESENNVGVLNSTRQSPPSDSDDIGLLKRNMPLPPSPVSVTENWVSSSTIHSASSG